VSLWRRLKKIGAVNLQQSVWILPLTGENHRLLCALKDEVLQNGGEAFVMKSSAEEADRSSLTGRFNAARDEEYGELLEQCGDFFQELEKETARKNFTFAEVEENEEELEKLQEWLSKISSRDFFGAPLREKAAQAISECRKRLEDFCERVYDFNNQG
jgi:vacuolar-type H+-ATPase subunit I/STV1